MNSYKFNISHMQSLEGMLSQKKKRKKRGTLWNRRAAAAHSAQCDCKTCEKSETLHFARRVLCVLCEPGNYPPRSLEEHWSSSNHDRGHVPGGRVWHSRKTQSAHDAKLYCDTSIYILLMNAHHLIDSRCKGPASTSLQGRIIVL